MHRFDFDGRYVYLSPTLEGYVGTIVLIMDLKDPARPQEVGRWWMPGQWTAGGETAELGKDAHRCHHPLRLGNRLYTSYWKGGFVILDIDDMTSPSSSPASTGRRLTRAQRTRRCRCLSRSAAVAIWSSPTRTCSAARHDPPAFMWMVDITDERHPVPVGSFQVEGIEGNRSRP